MAAVSAAVMAAAAASYSANRTKDWKAVKDSLPPVLDVKLACKCPGCGSFEFEMHGRRPVCSYCRTPQVG